MHFLMLVAFLSIRAYLSAKADLCIDIPQYHLENRIYNTSVQCNFLVPCHEWWFSVLAAQGVTMIKFLTDGVLLREMMDDPLLTKYRY